MPGRCPCAMPDERTKPSGKKWCGICGGWIIDKPEAKPRP